MHTQPYEFTDTPMSMHFDVVFFYSIGNSFLFCSFVLLVGVIFRYCLVFYCYSCGYCWCYRNCTCISWLEMFVFILLILAGLLTDEWSNAQYDNAISYASPLRFWHTQLNVAPIQYNFICYVHALLLMVAMRENKSYVWSQISSHISTRFIIFAQFPFDKIIANDL